MALSRVGKDHAAIMDFDHAVVLELGNAESYYQRGSSPIEMGVSMAGG